MNQLSPLRSDDAVRLYQRYRPDYPQRLTARVMALAGLRPGDAVLDLGAGPGFLALAFARAGMAVTAADPDAAMLDATAQAATKSGLMVKTWTGGSADLDAAMGPFAMVTMGRSFHWMDRAATLAMLDRIIAPGGAVALFHDAHPPVPQNAWFKVMCDVAGKFGRSSKGGGSGGGHQRYEPYLFASAFTQLDGLSVTAQCPVTADEIVGRAFSLSACAPEILGDKAGAFEAALRAGLAGLSPDGQFTEVLEMVALVARRPTGEK